MSGAGHATARDGAALGYRPRATLSVLTEWRRQARRRRTQFGLGFMVLLPLIVLAAFQFSDPQPADDDDFASLVSVATSGGPNFTVFTIFVSSGFLLIVLVALFCGDTVASEASWGSLRYLLAAPVPRSRLLGVKLAVALGYQALAMLLLTGTALAAGTARYGWHPLRSTAAPDLPPDAALRRLAFVLGYLAITQLVVAGMAFWLSVATDAPLGAVGGAVLLYILSSILDQITALGWLRNLLPTHFNGAWFGLLSTPVQTDDVVKGTIVSLCYATAFCALAWHRFLRKDVVS